MWEWDGNAWTNSVSATMPTARHSARAAYDADRNRVLLFGGIEAATGTGPMRPGSLIASFFVRREAFARQRS